MKQLELIKHKIVHRGFWPDRIKKPTKEEAEKQQGYEHGLIERGLADEWADYNDPEKNGPYGLQFLLNQAAQQNRLPRGFGDPELTQREAHIVADIIQWLGTNCGLGFLHAAFHRAGYRFEYVEDETERKRWMRNHKRREQRRRKKEAEEKARRERKVTRRMEIPD